MPKIRNIINSIIFTAVVIVMIFGVRWYDGYKKEKQEKGETKFTDYVKNDLKDIKQGMDTIPDILSEAMASGNSLKKSYADKMAGVIEIYADDHGKYPEKLSELVPVYIDKETLNQKNFYYKKLGNGYEIGITLRNGEVYKIKK